MAVCKLLIATVCVVLFCFSMNIVGSVSTTYLHSLVPLIQYVSTILKLLRPNSHEFSPFPPSALPNIFFQRRRRRKKGGVKAKHVKRPYRPFMPSVITGNVRSLNNKIDELSLLSKFHLDYREASMISLTKTWLTETTPSTYYDLDGFSLYRCDRHINSDKTCGGGSCTYINNKWCHRNNTHQVKKEASKDVELLTLSLRPHSISCLGSLPMCTSRPSTHMRIHTRRTSITLSTNM